MSQVKKPIFDVPIFNPSNYVTTTTVTTTTSTGPIVVKIIVEAGQSSTSGTVLYPTWSTTPAFSNNYLNPVNTSNKQRIQFPSVGYYLITSNVCFAGGIGTNNAANQGYELFNSSGTAILQSNVQSGNGSPDSVRNTASFIIYVSDTTQYLRFYFYQNSGSSIAIGSSGFETTYLCITKLQ